MHKPSSIERRKRRKKMELELAMSDQPPSVGTPTDPPEITLRICGTKLCRDGQPHDDFGHVVIRDEQGRAVGGSVACSRCGSSAMARDLMRLP